MIALYHKTNGRWIMISGAGMAAYDKIPSAPSETGSVGTELSYSRGDHSHPLQTFVEQANTANSATSATNATNAVNAQKAETAVNAESATNATNAVNAENAVKADSATTAESANKLSKEIKLTLSGNVTGEVSFDGSTDVSLNTTVVSSTQEVTVEANSSSTVSIPEWVKDIKSLRVDLKYIGSNNSYIPAHLVGGYSVSSSNITIYNDSSSSKVFVVTLY